jgi:SsrA-binding protein
MVVAWHTGDQAAHLERVRAERLAADRVEGVGVETEHVGTISTRDVLGSLDPTMAKSKPPKGTKPGTKLIASNRQARRNYTITDVLEAGVVLQGSEVKAMREAQVQLSDAFARIRDGEAWLEGVHVAPYAYAHGFGSHTPDRPRKLLLHRDEIRRLKALIDTERVALVPMSLYFKEGRVKVELGVGKGRTKGDKRQAIAARDSQRDIERELGRANKYGY